MAENTQPAAVISKLLDITPRRLQQLAQDGIVPKADRGRYPLVGCVQGYIRFLRDRHVGGDIDGDDGTVDARKERALLARAQREKVVLETEVLRGRLIPAEQVETIWGGMIANFRTRCLSIPVKAASSIMAALDLAEAESILKDLIYEALGELADYDPAHYRTSPQDSEDSGAATQSDSERMGGRKPAIKQRGKRRAGPMEH